MKLMKFIKLSEIDSERNIYHTTTHVAQQIQQKFY